MEEIDNIRAFFIKHNKLMAVKAASGNDFC